MLLLECCLWLQELQIKQQALEAFHETLAVFNEHIRISEKGLKLAPPHELRRYILMVICCDSSCNRKPFYIARVFLFSQLLFQLQI